MTPAGESDAFPVVLQANQVQFAPAERLAFPRVESRMVLVCLGGSGAVRVNGRAYELERGAAFVLPWAHSIAYSAGAIDPFHVGGAHLVPRHDAGFTISPTVPHGPRHDLAGCTWRNDAPELGGRDVVTTTATQRRDYTTSWSMRLGHSHRGGLPMQ